jgi:hypothetical protein
VFKNRNAKMSEISELKSNLLDVTGEEGCGVSCQDADVFKDEEGCKMMLEGFMEPWHLGSSLDEARQSIKEYAHMGFGLS